MNKRTRHVFLVVLGQAGCLAVGLAMQQRFLVSSVELSAVNRTFDQFELEADRIADQFELEFEASLEKPGAQPREDSPARLTSAMSAAGLAEAHATITGPSWEVISSTAFKGNGGTLHWKQAPARREGIGTHLTGILEMREGPHLAVAARLGSEHGYHGYLLLHRSKSQVEAEARSLLGSVAALSLLTFVWTWALLGVLAYMLLARFHDQAEKERARSAAEGMRQRQDLIRTRDAVVFGLAKLADSRDPETGDHLERISVYSTMLATVLRQHPKYGKQVTPAFVRLIGISSALHDIGKVGVEDDILLKPGPLTSDERVRMQLHPHIGGDCLREIEQRLGSSNFLQMAREIALAHHERWDGTGYPNGLRREEIPLSARIVAIADVYDALSSRRVYKEPQAHDECVEIMRKAAGTQFDPDLIEAWLAITPKFAEVSKRYCAFEAARRKHEMDEQNKQNETHVASTKKEEQLAPAQVG